MRENKTRQPEHLAILKAISTLAFEAVYISEAEKWGGTMDQWKLILTVSANKKHEVFAFDYWQGLGHRVGHFEERRNQITIGGRSKLLHEAKKTHRVLTMNPTGHHSYSVKVPTVADAMYCLLGERTHGEDFDGWASNFGYDTDSRKAFDIYLQCQDHEKQLNRLFTAEQVETIETILEDY